jgi:hypothetical protein
MLNPEDSRHPGVHRNIMTRTLKTSTSGIFPQCSVRSHIPCQESNAASRDPNLSDRHSISEFSTSTSMFASSKCQLPNSSQNAFTLHILLFLASSLGTTHSQETSQAPTCTNGYTLCAPSGTSTTPQLGDQAFQNLYSDLLSSSLPSNDPNISPPAALPQSSIANANSLCCNH